MQTSRYQQAFDRIRAEYQEMPDMRLTAEEVERLSGVERDVCRVVLEDLAFAGFLSRCQGQRYCRTTATSVVRNTAGRHVDHYESERSGLRVGEL